MDLLPIWHQALAEIEMQMTRATFQTWVIGLVPEGVECDGEGCCRMVVNCPSAYVMDWCANRLDVVIRRTVAGVMGVDALEIEYVVQQYSKEITDELGTIGQG